MKPTTTSPLLNASADEQSIDPLARMLLATSFLIHLDEPHHMSLNWHDAAQARIVLRSHRENLARNFSELLKDAIITPNLNGKTLLSLPEAAQIRAKLQRGRQSFELLIERTDDLTCLASLRDISTDEALERVREESNLLEAELGCITPTSFPVS